MKTSSTKKEAPQGAFLVEMSEPFTISAKARPWTNLAHPTAVPSNSSHTFGCVIF